MTTFLATACPLVGILFEVLRIKDNLPQKYRMCTHLLTLYGYLLPCSVQWY